MNGLVLSSLWGASRPAAAYATRAVTMISATIAKTRLKPLTKPLNV